MHKVNVLNDLQFTASALSISVVTFIYQLIYVGYGVYYSPLIDLEYRVLYTIFLIMYVGISGLLFSFHISINQQDLKSLTHIYVISILFGPVGQVLLMLVGGFPLFENGNLEYIRIAFREKYPIQTYLLIPVTLISVAISSFFIVNKVDIKKNVLVLVLASFVGFLSGFRAVGVNPFITLFLMYIIHLLTRYNNWMRLFFKMMHPIKLIVLGVVGMSFIFLLMYLTSKRMGVDSVFDYSVINALYSRIFLESAEINIMRYLYYFENNGPQYGMTYLQDLLSVVRLEEYSFQEMLSGYREFVMTSPLYAELYVNWGWGLPIIMFGSIFIFPVLKKITVFAANLFRLSNASKAVFVLVMFFSIVLSLGHHGFSKISFVIFPKFFISFLFVLMIKKITKSFVRSFS